MCGKAADEAQADVKYHAEYVDKQGLGRRARDEYLTYQRY